MANQPSRLRCFVAPLIPRIQRYTVFELGRQDRLTPPPTNAEIHIEQVTAGNVGAVASFRDENVLNTFRRYLADQDLGVYAYCGDAVVGHAWAAVWHGANRWVWDYMPVTADTACICFCSVSPAFRGRKIYQQMIVALTELVFASTDVRRILIDTAIDNGPSLSAIERVGFRRLLVLPVVRWRLHALGLRRIPRAQRADR